MKYNKLITDRLDTTLCCSLWYNMQDHPESAESQVIDIPLFVRRKYNLRVYLLELLQPWVEYVWKIFKQNWIFLMRLSVVAREYAGKYTLAKIKYELLWYLNWRCFCSRRSSFAELTMNKLYDKIPLFSM